MSEHTITTIDCHYGAPGLAAAYLIAEPGHAAFIDNNTSKAVPYLLDALHAAGMRGKDVEFVIVTHIHLDHSAGTAELLTHCPNATVLCDPRAARHLIDPTRLVQSSKQVYGDVAFEQLYGAVQPVDASRVQTVPDGETVALGTRTLTFLHTEGHARHHFCVLDSKSNSVFSGDAFGLAYARLPAPDATYVMCSSSPTEFDAAAARASATRLLDSGVARAYVTHYGTVTDMPAACEQLVDSIDRMETILDEANTRDESGVELIAWCKERIAATMAEHARRYAPNYVAQIQEWFDKDYWLNAMGLAYLAERERRRQARTA